MLEDLDLEAASQLLLATGPVVGIGPLTLGSAAFDAGDVCGLIDGDMQAATNAQGRTTIIVQGSLTGTRERPCTIRAGQLAIVLGSAAHAVVTGETIRIAGNVSHCRLTAAVGIQIDGDLSASQVLVGAFDENRRQIEALQHRIPEVTEEQRLLSQRLGIEERRVGKLVKATRVNCEMALGQMIRLHMERIRVDLQTFYRVIGDREPAQMEAALMDFFTRAVIGRLAHANQAYLQANPNNQKVFVRILTDLRQLFMLTLQFDQCARRKERLVEALSTAIEEAPGQRPTLHLHGTVCPDVQLQFVVPEVLTDDDGDLSFVAHSARLSISSGDRPTGCMVHQVDADGTETDSFATHEQLRGLTLALEDGRAVAQPLPRRRPKPNARCD